MQVTETKTEGLRREFKIAVPAQEIEQRVNTRLADIARTAHLPGFRPGKAPVTLLRKKFGDAVRGEVLERTVGDSAQQALTDRGLRPAAEPKVEVTAFDKDLEFTLAVDILPEIKPIDFKAILLERLAVTVDEGKVEDALKRIADSQRDTKPAAEGKAAAKGDHVVIDFVGSIDGKEFPGGKAEGYSLELGSGSFIPGFEDRLVGVKVGEQPVVKVRFPDDYGAAELAGKEAAFAVTVKEVRESAPAAVDDKLAERVGFANLEALKARVREEQTKEFKEMSRTRLKRNLLDVLHAGHDFEVPAAMVDAEFDAIWNRFEESRKAAKNGEESDATPLTEEEKAKSDDEHRADFREIAERRVRLGLLLAEVGRVNNIQVSQEDINRALTNEARRFPGQEQAVVDFYRKNPQALQALTGPIYEDKVVDFILEMAKISEREVSLEEFLKVEGEAEAEAAAGKGAKKKAAAKKPAAKKEKKD